MAWWALPLALGAGLGARRLADAVRGRGPAVLAAAGLVGAAALLLPVIAVPDLVWGVGGRLQPVAYPADWQRVRDVVAADAGPGDVLVLPFGAYRSFDWNDDRPQLDPAPRWLTRPTVVDDELVVGGAAGRRRGRPRPRRSPRRPTTRPRWPSSASAGCWSSDGTPGRPVPASVTALPLGRGRRGPRSCTGFPGAATGPSALARSGDSGGGSLTLARSASIVGAVLWITTLRL